MQTLPIMLFLYNYVFVLFRSGTDGKYVFQVASDFFVKTSVVGERIRNKAT